MLSTTADWVAEASKIAGAREVWLVEVALRNPADQAEPLRMFTGHGTIVFDGHTWYGDEGLGQIVGMDNSSDDAFPRARLTLQHLSPIVSAALNYPVQGAPVRIFQGWLTQEGTLISPLLLWEGFIDTMHMVDHGTSIDIEVSAISYFEDMSKPKNFRLGPAQQRVYRSDDTSMDWLPSMDGLLIRFPKGEWFRRNAR